MQPPLSEEVRDRFRALDDDELLSVNFSYRCAMSLYEEEMRHHVKRITTASDKEALAEATQRTELGRQTIRATRYEMADRGLDERPLPPWEQRVACDYCGATEGQPCVSSQGQPTRFPHKPRYRQMLPLYTMWSAEHRGQG